MQRGGGKIKTRARDVRLDQIGGHRTAHVAEADEAIIAMRSLTECLRPSSFETPPAAALMMRMARDNQPHDLVRAFQNLVHAQVADDFSTP